MDTGVLNISDGNQVAAGNSFSGSFSRVTSLASGTQAITGVGFKPRAVHFLMIDSAATAL